MQQVIPIQTPRRADHPALRLLLLGLSASATLTGCVKKDDNPNCVSVGSGWRACSVDAATSVDSGTVDQPDGSGPPTQTDAGTRTTTPPPRGQAGTQAASTGRAGTGSALGAGSASDFSESSEDAGASAAGSGGAASGAAGLASAGSGGAPRAAGTGGMNAGRGGGTAGGGAAGSGAGGMSSLPVTCCHSQGVCVSSGDLSVEQRAFLGRESCTDEAALCAPVEVLDNKSFVPKTCRSVLQSEGRCLPDCMSNLARQGARLPQDICDAHQLCSPCFDPATGNATGSCSLGADPGPRELPQVFGSCCNAADSAPALCVPQTYVPAGALMPPADCAAGLYCVPRALVNDPTAKPAACNAEVRGAGICLPQCIASALVPLVTVQANCNTNEKCYPCELIGGTATGVCGAQ
jgi:hypothetical protein